MCLSSVLGVGVEFGFWVFRCRCLSVLGVGEEFVIGFVARDMFPKSTSYLIQIFKRLLQDIRSSTASRRRQTPRPAAINLLEEETVHPDTHSNACCQIPARGFR
jgi:hypothetical protein